MLKSYREQFRDKNRNDAYSNVGTKYVRKIPPSRPTAARQQSPRSDTVGSTKRSELNSKVFQDNSVQSNVPRIPHRERVAKNSSLAPEKVHSEATRKYDNIRTRITHRSSPADSQNLGRKPARFTSKNNGTYNSSSSSFSSIHYQNLIPLYPDTSHRSRHIRVANNEYVIRRQRKPVDYTYDEYRVVSNEITNSFIKFIEQLIDSFYCYYSSRNIVISRFVFSLSFQYFFALFLACDFKLLIFNISFLIIDDVMIAAANCFIRSSFLFLTYSQLRSMSEEKEKESLTFLVRLSR